MKFAFMSFSTPQLTLSEMLKTAAELGYQGIEPRAQSDHAHGVQASATKAQRQEMRRIWQDSGVEMCCIATSCRYVDPEIRQGFIDDTFAHIDLAGDLGCKRIRVFGGALPAGVSREQAVEAVVAALRQVANHAKDRDVLVCMETHDDWCDPADVAQVMRLVNHPNIAVNWDIMHPVRKAGASIDDAYKTLKPWIRHCHVHDGEATPTGKLLPIGQGVVDHSRAIQLLKADGFEGYLSGEWIKWSDWREHLPSELATLRRLAGQ